MFFILLRHDGHDLFLYKYKYAKERIKAADIKIINRMTTRPPVVCQKIVSSQYSFCEFSVIVHLSFIGRTHCLGMAEPSHIIYSSCSNTLNRPAISVFTYQCFAFNIVCIDTFFKNSNCFDEIDMFRLILAKLLSVFFGCDCMEVSSKTLYTQNIPKYRVMYLNSIVE